MNKYAKVIGIVHDEKTKSNIVTEFDVIIAPYMRLILEWREDEDGSLHPHKILDLKEVALLGEEGTYHAQAPILKSWIDIAQKSD